MNILKIAEVPPAVVALTTTVLEAVQVMVSKRVGAVAVVQEDRLAGIFTERDVMLRVVLASRDPTTTTMRDVLTPSMETNDETTRLWLLPSKGGKPRALTTSEASTGTGTSGA